MKLKNIQAEIVTSLDGTNAELYHYLPYLLKDLWDIGTNPKTIMQLIRKHNILENADKQIVLDLGCGKGAVAINIAKEFGCRVHGVDAMEAFIEEANNFSIKYLVGHLCSFEVEDIRNTVNRKEDYDLVIFGAVSPTVVFSNYQSAFSALNTCVKSGGYLIVDDGYLPDGSGYVDNGLVNYSELKHIIEKTGFKIVDEFEEKELEEMNRYYNALIMKRANELIVKFPEKKMLFEGYVNAQIAESEILEKKIENGVLLLQKI